MLPNQEIVELEYSQLLSLPQWKDKRKEILQRDGAMCRMCSCKDSLQVHHRQYHIIKSTGKFKDPWCYEKAQLITLCNKCHNAGHQNYTIPVFIVKE